MVQAILWDPIPETDKRTDQASRLNFFSYDSEVPGWDVSGGPPPRGARHGSGERTTGNGSVEWGEKLMMRDLVVRTQDHDRER